MDPKTNRDKSWNSDLQPGEIQSEVDMEICGSSDDDEVPRPTKRPRLTVDKEKTLPESFINVSYKHLPRDSKLKFRELMLEWSQWHTKHCSSLTDSGNGSESGEYVFHPAIQVGSDKSHLLSFWMENGKELKSQKDENSVPIYDRGFALPLTSKDTPNNLGSLELGEGSRCFNCGSYSHALKDCTKPRDNVAVNNARKQHVSKRNQNASSRNNPTRYFQDGKFHGLKPGNLEPETRRVLGLGELDPPPWLHRMREIGYPPGYLDVKDQDDQPSGITIFGLDDENVKDGDEEGVIVERSKSQSVKFPGVNAPVPEKADKKLWADRRINVSADYNSRKRRSHDNHDQRPHRGFEREPPPPGCDIERHPRRYGDYDPRRNGGYSFGRRSHDDYLAHYFFRY